MMDTMRRKPVLYLVAAASLVIVTAGIRATADLLNPVLFATFLALLMQPVTEWLQRRRVPGGLAITLVVLVVIATGLAVVGFMAASMQEVIAAVPTYATKLAEQLDSLVRLAATRGIEIDLNALPGRVLRSPEFGARVLAFSQGVAGTLGNLALTFFIFAFMVGGVSRLDARVDSGEVAKTGLEARFMAFSDVIRRYMWIRAVLGLAAAVLNYLLLLALGVDFALLWGVLSFVLSFVPNIGYTLSVIPPVLVALVDGGWQNALFVFLGYTVINNVLDNVVGPRYVGAQMQMSALLSFLSVIFWAWVLGPTGAILAIPITVFLRDVLMADPEVAVPAPAPAAGPPAAPPPPPQQPPAGAPPAALVP